MCYATRVKWERQNLAESRLTEPQEMLSGNSKTGVSLNLPVLNCRPSAKCAKSCYACTGPISFGNSIRKALVVDQKLKRGDIDRLAEECARRDNVRLCGSGDLTPEQVPHIIKLAQRCPGTVFWGFTRKVQIAKAINGRAKNLSVILSFDGSSRDQKFKGYRGRLAFGPRLPGDEVPKDRRLLVVFPEHIHGQTTKGVERHKLDCPTSRGAEHDNACEKCRRCWRP